MLRALIEVGQQQAGVGRNHRGLIVLPGEGAHRVQGLKGHNGDKFHLIPDVAAQKLNAPVAFDFPIPNVDENFMLEQIFVGVGVSRGRPSVLDTADHRFSPGAIFGSPHSLSILRQRRIQKGGEHRQQQIRTLDNPYMRGAREDGKL